MINLWILCVLAIDFIWSLYRCGWAFDQCSKRNSKKKHTLIQDSKLFPYLFWKASLISPKSISDLLTMIRIKVLSFVPIPAIELCRRSAKKSTFDLQHLTKEKGKTLTSTTSNVQCYTNWLPKIQPQLIHWILSWSPFQYHVRQYSHIPWIFVGVVDTNELLKWNWKLILRYPIVLHRLRTKH